jgi:SCP-2 sterol transfer family protein
VATKRQVETKLRELIKRLEEADEGVTALSGALPEPRVIEVYLPDLDESFWTELASGKMGKLHAGKPHQADIRLEADSDDLVEVLDGRRSMFSSYVAGRMKVEASFADIMRLRKLA